MEVLKSRTCCGWPIQIGVSVIALVEITKLIVTLAGLGWINLVEPMITKGDLHDVELGSFLSITSVTVLHLVFSCLLYKGARTLRWRLCIPWFCWTAVYFVFEVIVLVYYIVTKVSDGSLEKDYKEMAMSSGTLAVVITLICGWYYLQAYFLWVVYSFTQSCKEECEAVGQRVESHEEGDDDQMKEKCESKDYAEFHKIDL